MRWAQALRDLGRPAPPSWPHSATALRACASRNPFPAVAWARAAHVFAETVALYRDADDPQDTPIAVPVSACGGGPAEPPGDAPRLAGPTWDAEKGRGLEQGVAAI